MRKINAVLAYFLACETGAKALAAARERQASKEWEQRQVIPDGRVLTPFNGTLAKRRARLMPRRGDYFAADVPAKREYEEAGVMLFRLHVTPVPEWFTAGCGVWPRVESGQADAPFNWTLWEDGTVERVWAGGMCLIQCKRYTGHTRV